MKTFDVLHRDLNIRKNFLIEASAGTGKTFSIENIVVRLLLEESNNSLSSLNIDQILVVTFTRIATRDLKFRIRNNIEKSLKILRGFRKFSENKFKIPDFLTALIEKGPTSIKVAKKRLEHALLNFDQAQIFTIHSFCSRMLRINILEGDVNIDSLSGKDEQLTSQQMISIIRDFFRSGLDPSKYCEEQLNIALKHNRNRIEELEQELLKLQIKGYEFTKVDNFTELYQKFVSSMTHFISHYKFESEKIFEDFNAQISNYKKQGDLEEVFGKVQYFASLFGMKEWSTKHFETLINDDLVFVRNLNPKMLKISHKNKAAPNLHYPHLYEILLSDLIPIINQARNYSHIISRMAFDVQNMIRDYVEDEEKFSFNNFLQLMLKGLSNPNLISYIRQYYKAAIIDEFQDTDPIQWKIFHSLFLENAEDWGNLYLVGDPKQSIYAFRQADIYTYLSAAESIGSENHTSLNTNFRSQPSLVHALNLLFKSSQGFISLPKKNIILEYPEVLHSPLTEQKTFSDQRNSLHFFIAKSEGKSKNYPLEILERKQFFPFIVEEIQRLHKQDYLTFSQFTILVRDRFQAERLSSFLHVWGLPNVMQKNTNITDSPALNSIKELLKAVINPHDLSQLKISLSGNICKLNLHEIKNLDDQTFLENIVNIYFVWKRILKTEGFSSFLDQVMETSLNGDDTISHCILTEATGLDFFNDLQQISQLIIEQQSHNHIFPEKIIEFLDNLKNLDNDGEIDIRRNSHSLKDAIQIMTLHSSKGLEFDVVFALGLIN